MPFSSRFVIMAVLILFVSGQAVRSQSTEKFEVGGQFSVLQISRITTAKLQPSIPGPSILIGKERDTQLGFGGRIGYNVNNTDAVEGELNFFPDAGTVGAQLLGEGHNLQGLFGVKIGKRFDKVGIFAKARPGFLSESNGDLQPQTQGVCILIFPPPVGCFDAVRKTHFAFDVGGVVEVYPTKRTVIRFDLGDTIIHAGVRTVPAQLSTHLGAVIIPAETTNNFQASIGFAYRF